jgi:AcrR family transcriptional regulator
VAAQSTPSVPVRRRPANRRALIIAAAADLFAEHGYHNVSLAQVAAAVDIAAPSLYRHFRNKQDLLREVVRDAIQSTYGLIAGQPTIDEFLTATAALTLSRRSAPIMWQREARNLDDEVRLEFWRELAAAGAKLSELIQAARPRLSDADAALLAWAVVSVFSSVSFHRVSVPRREYEDLLVALATAAVQCRLRPGDGSIANRRDSGLPLSTREMLLNEAVRLFDQRGFGSVSTDDIGAAAGTSGPNIYKHFATKHDLLSAAVMRAGERRRAAVADALASGAEPDQQLRALLAGYIGFAIENRHLLGVLVSELDQLPDRQRRAAKQNQREFVALWADLLQQIRPALDPSAARITVLAALAIVDNVVRTAPFNRRPDLASRLREICSAVLRAA